MASDSTEFSERFFRVVLPGKWADVTRQTDEGVWEYESENGTERLTVSLFFANNEQTDEEISSMFDSFVRVRRQAEAEAGGQDVLLTDTVRRNVPNAIIGTYNGTEGMSRAFADKVIVNTFGIANFYYEAIGLTKESFELRRDAIFRETGFIGK